MVGDMHPKGMIMNNISSQQCSEVYTVIKLPASTSSKGTASVHVKIDTRSGGNILPLHLFQQLHPKQTSPDGLPIGLDPVGTKLTAYNGSLIPLYGILCSPILWQGNTPGPQPHMIHSYCYITDTPGPVLLGLPACKKLAVVQVNCAIGTTQPNKSLTGTTPTQAARAAKPLTARTPKSKCIKSTDDLTREFPHRFTGIDMIDSLELTNSQVNIRYNCTQMLIQSYTHPENARLHYIPRSRSTWQKWKPWK